MTDNEYPNFRVRQSDNLCTFWRGPFFEFISISIMAWLGKNTWNILQRDEYICFPLSTALTGLLRLFEDGGERSSPVTKNII